MYTNLTSLKGQLADFGFAHLHHNAVFCHSIIPYMNRQWMHSSHWKPQLTYRRFLCIASLLKKENFLIWIKVNKETIFFFLFSLFLLIRGSDIVSSGIQVNNRNSCTLRSFFPPPTITRVNIFLFLVQKYQIITKHRHGRCCYRNYKYQYSGSFAV